MYRLIFDIGANVGSWTLANINKADKFITIEASPKTFKRLENNINNNKVELLEYAVCNNNGEDITFYDADCDVLSTINKEWLTADTSRFHNYTKYKQINVKTVTIDSLIKTYGIPDLIKVDVEGGEYECISSLTQKVDMLCFEWASEVNNINIKCLDYLHTLGFTKFFIQAGDDYSFHPTEFYDINTCKNKLLKTVPKQDWGMLWCV
jgi:FkbM family methyltransferase